VLVCRLEVAEDDPKQKSTQDIEDISLIEDVSVDSPENAQFIFQGRHKDMLEPKGNVKKDVFDIMSLLLSFL
jgi:hypothetical protein